MRIMMVHCSSGVVWCTKIVDSNISLVLNDMWEDCLMEGHRRLHSSWILGILRLCSYRFCSKSRCLIWMGRESAGGRGFLCLCLLGKPELLSSVPDSLSVSLSEVVTVISPDIHSSNTHCLQRIKHLEVVKLFQPTLKPIPVEIKWCNKIGRGTFSDLSHWVPLGWGMQIGFRLFRLSPFLPLLIQTFALWSPGVWTHVWQYMISKSWEYI